MKYQINIGAYPITLENLDLAQHLDVDELTTINTSNIFGEAVTMSAATNQIGLLKSDAQASLSISKLNLRLFESEFKKDKRKQAFANSGYFLLVDNETKVKATEKALETCFEDNEKWIILKKQIIENEKSLAYLESLYWSMQDKSRKLNNLMTSTTPKEFVDELVEGKINGILIKK